MGMFNKDSAPVINDKNNYFGTQAGITNEQFGLTADNGAQGTKFQLGGPIQFSTFEAAYVSSSLAHAICTQPVMDATVNERVWQTGNEEWDAKLKEAEQRLGYWDALRHHMINSRIYGGSLLFPIFNNHNTDLNTPFHIKEVGLNSMKMFRSLDRWSSYKIINSTTSLSDPLSDDFLAPSQIVMAFSGMSLNGSRVIIEDGIYYPIRQWMNNNWYGVSILGPIMRDIQNFETIKQSAAYMTTMAQYQVLKLAGLKTTVSDPQGAANLDSRMASLNRYKGFAKAIVIGEDDDWISYNPSFDGFMDLMKSQLQNIGYNTGIPLAYLQSESQAGLAASGASSAEDDRYAKTIQKLQSQMSKQMALMDAYLVADVLGWRQVTDNPNLVWSWVQSDHTSGKEKADNMAVELANLQLAVEQGFLHEHEAREQYRKLVKSKEVTYGVAQQNQNQSWV